MKFVALISAVLFGAVVLVAPAYAACKDELAALEKKVGDIKDAKKKAEVEKHWKEGDTAAKAGKEADCMKAVEAAKKASM
ncbi:MAG: hypothetical protein EXQ91_04875 [Alphaproteobacteria bacterium]|nr:hypothetical protein [Alphaproteobacteria bacterium]